MQVGWRDKPGQDVVNALTAQPDLEVALSTYKIKDRVLEVAIDLSKPVAALDLVADNDVDISFIRASVSRTFEQVPIEVTDERPYDLFLPYMLRTRGLSREPDPIEPAGCLPPSKDSRPDLDVVRALAARIDFERNESKWLSFRDVRVIEGVGIDLEGRVASLDVVVDDGSDKGESELALVKGAVPKTFEGVPVEVSVIETVDVTGGIVSSAYRAYSGSAPSAVKAPHEP
jgi:hypothetical protein